MYIICNINEDRFVKHNEQSGSFVLTDKKDQARLFPNINKASNVMVHNCAKLRKITNLKVIEVEDVKEGEKQKKNMIDFIEEQGNQTIEDFVPADSNIYNTLKLIQKIQTDLEYEKQSIEMQLTHVCRGITDTYHYRRYKPQRTDEERRKLDILETELQCKRRDLKRELEIIEFTLRNYKKDGFNEMLKDFMQTRPSYTPREFPELFEKGEIPVFEEWFMQYTL